MTLQPGARTVAYVPGLQYLFQGGPHIGITCETDDLLAFEEFTIVEFQADGTAKASEAQSITGDNDKWDVLAVILNYCGWEASGGVPYTSATAQMWLASVSKHAAATAILKWWTDKAMTQINAELNTEYPAGSAAAPATTSATDIVDLINYMLSLSTVSGTPGSLVISAPAL